MATPLLLYKFDEASSGTSPANVLDTSAGTAVNLPIQYGTSAWTSIGSGKGLNFNGSCGARTTATLVGTKAETALTGSKTITVEIRADMSATDLQALWYLWSLNTDPIQWIVNAASDGFFIRVAGVDVGGFEGITTSGLHTFHLVVDTSQATASNRVKFYIDGSLQTLTGATWPTQNDPIDVASPDWADLGISIGCDEGYGGTSMVGSKVYFCAVYSGALTSGEVSANHTALSSNNDADPNGLAPTINTQPVGQTLAAGGTPTALSVSATASSGGGSLSYQWELDGPGNNISGETSSTYQPPTASASQNGHSYTCLVTDSNGSTRTAAAQILVTTSELSYLFADFTQIGTGFADTGLSFPVAASTDYVFRFALRVWCNATTTGARFQLTGPASPTSVAVGAFIPSNTGVAFIGAVTAMSTTIAASTAGRTSATPLLVIIEGIFRNGANAGTLSLQAAAEVTSPGSVTVAAGSCGAIAIATGSTFCRVSSTQTTTGTTFANVTGLSFSLSASTKYRFRFVVFHTGNATTTGARFGVTAPTSPTSLRIGSQQNSGTAAQDSGSINATATIIAAATSGPGSTMTWSLIEGVIQNGSNSGTLQLQSAAEIASPGTVIVAVDSFGILEVVT